MPPIQALQVLERKLERRIRLIERKNRALGLKIERKIASHKRRFEQHLDVQKDKIERKIASHKRRFGEHFDAQKEKFEQKFKTHIRRFEEKNGIRIDDEFRFFKSWIEKPFAIGAVTPSGKALARTMAA